MLNASLRKTCSVFISACVLCAAFSVSAFAMRRLGDADRDGAISAADARLALRCAVGLEDYPEGSEEFLACDADKDGKITANDARAILRAAVELEPLSKEKVGAFSCCGTWKNDDVTYVFREDGTGERVFADGGEAEAFVYEADEVYEARLPEGALALCLANGGEELPFAYAQPDEDTLSLTRGEDPEILLRRVYTHSARLFGVWKNNDVTYILRSDGSGVLVFAETGRGAAFRYRPDADAKTLTLFSGGESPVFTYTLSGNTLTLTAEDGTETVLTLAEPRELPYGIWKNETLTFILRADGVGIRLTEGMGVDLIEPLYFTYRVNAAEQRLNAGFANGRAALSYALPNENTLVLIEDGGPSVALTREAAHEFTPGAWVNGADVCVFRADGTGARNGGQHPFTYETDASAGLLVMRYAEAVQTYTCDLPDDNTMVLTINGMVLVSRLAARSDFPFGTWKNGEVTYIFNEYAGGRRIVFNGGATTYFSFEAPQNDGALTLRTDGAGEIGYAYTLADENTMLLTLANGAQITLTRVTDALRLPGTWENGSMTLRFEESGGEILSETFDLWDSFDYALDEANRRLVFRDREGREETVAYDMPDDATLILTHGNGETDTLRFVAGPDFPYGTWYQTDTRVGYTFDRYGGGEKGTVAWGGVSALENAVSFRFESVRYTNLIALYFEENDTDLRASYTRPSDGTLILTGVSEAPETLTKYVPK